MIVRRGGVIYSAGRGPGRDDVTAVPAQRPVVCAPVCHSGVSAILRETVFVRMCVVCVFVRMCVCVRVRIYVMLRVCRVTQWTM